MISGTTEFGDFDDTVAINQVARKHGIWHHVDVGWAGYLAWANEEKKGEMFSGIDLADSVAFNPHEGWGIPRLCSAVLTNGHKGHLSEAFKAVFKFDLEDNDRTIYSGRRADGVKLFLTLKKHGIGGLRKIANRSINNARHLVERISSHENFELVH